MAKGRGVPKSPTVLAKISRVTLSFTYLTYFTLHAKVKFLLQWDRASPPLR